MTQCEMPTTIHEHEMGVQDPGVVVRGVLADGSLPPEFRACPNEATHLFTDGRHSLALCADHDGGTDSICCGVCSNRGGAPVFYQLTEDVTREEK